MKNKNQKNMFSRGFINFGSCHTLDTKEQNSKLLEFSGIFSSLRLFMPSELWFYHECRKRWCLHQFTTWLHEDKAETHFGGVGGEWEHSSVTQDFYLSACIHFCLNNICPVNIFKCTITEFHKLLQISCVNFHTTLIMSFKIF